MKILAHIKFADLDDFHMIMSKGKSLSMRAELIYYVSENFDTETYKFSRTSLLIIFRRSITHLFVILRLLSYKQKYVMTRLLDCHVIMRKGNSMQISDANSSKF